MKIKLEAIRKVTVESTRGFCLITLRTRKFPKMELLRVLVPL